MAKYLPKQFNIVASKPIKDPSLSSFEGKKGIYFMQPRLPSAFGALGHITTWNGNACLGGHCYNTSTHFYQATLIR